MSFTQCLVGGISSTALGSRQGYKQLDRCYLLHVAYIWMVYLFAKVALNAEYFSFNACCLVFENERGEECIVKTFYHLFCLK